MRDWELHLGDALEVLPGMAGGSVDAVVADPPAGVGFMGAAFDTFNDRAHFLAFLTPIMAQCLRVLKPGGYALVWALPRTSHWTATALEDAGLEIRDVIVHITAQGFPKGKGCLKPAAEHWVLCRRPGPRVLPLNIDESRVPVGEETITAGHADSIRRGTFHEHEGWQRPWKDDAEEHARRREEALTRANTLGRYPANLCLSHHPLCVCRGTKRVKVHYSQPTKGRDNTGNVYGTGSGLDRKTTGQPVGYAGPDGAEEVEDWCCVESCPVRLLDEQAGERTTGGGVNSPGEGGIRQWKGKADGIGGGRKVESRRGLNDTGNASRFFATFPAENCCVLCDLPLGDAANSIQACNVNTAEQVSSPKPGDVGSVPFGVSACGRHDGGNRAGPLRAPVNSAGKSSVTLPATIASSVPSGASESLTESLVRSARSAAPLCGSCAIAFAQSVAAALRGDDAASPLGQASIPAHRRQTLTRSLALYAAGRGSTATIPITHDLSLLLGSVRPATPPDIPASATADGSGPTARLFYCSKADRTDRGEGNDHPTTKSTALMSWLVKLVTRPGETVLDPFAGSGSTGAAALRCERRFVGIERDAHYHAIALKRLAAVDGPLFAAPAGESPAPDPDAAPMTPEARAELERLHAEFRRGLAEDGGVWPVYTGGGE